MKYLTMNKKQKIKLIQEITKAEEEQKKYSLGSPSLCYVFTQDIANPKIFWRDNKRFSENEVNVYSKYNRVIRVIYASNIINQ